MPDLSYSLLTQLRGHMLDKIPVAEDILMPSYHGYSLSNIPSTVCHLLGIPSFGEHALGSELLEKLGGPYQRVILLVVDALGYHLLNKLMDSGYAKFWKDRLRDSVYFPLTSICPSTTASALTTLWTGVSPATHAVVGYEMWAREFGMVINNILHSAMSFVGDTGGLKRAGFEPNEFLKSSTLGPHLNQHGIDADAFMHYSIGSSGLSSMHLNQVNFHGYVGESDMWVSMRNVLNADPHGRKYIYAYSSEVDTLTHRFSLNDERIALHFKYFSEMLEEGLIKGLSPSERKNTLLILTADHGSIFTPRYGKFNLTSHPELNALLRIQPTCENRLVFLYIKPGMEDAVRSYFEAAWSGKFSLINGKQAIAAGLFGPEPHAPTLEDRIGDLIAIAHEDAYLWWAAKQNVMLGRHGGLSPEEMLIPFYAITL